MGDLGPATRRSLAERGIVPRLYAADDAAIFARSPSLSSFALLDEGDHLRVATVLPGLDSSAALSTSLGIAERVGKLATFARRPGLGWICARLADCGLGASLTATVHIPALVAAGMRDRLFRSLLADGVALRGYYSASEDSVGSVYELVLEARAASSLRELEAAFSAAAAKVVAAERRARAEVASRGGASLVDAEGRAFGIARYFANAGADEAASLVSVLRLAAIRGALTGADPRLLGALLTALGPASVSLADGGDGLAKAEAQEARRARLVKRVLARAEYATVEDDRCSKD